MIHVSYYCRHIFSYTCDIQLYAQLVLCSICDILTWVFIYSFIHCSYSFLKELQVNSLKIQLRLIAGKWITN